MWIRSSFCEANACVEVGVADVKLPSFVYVRDSKDPGGPVLRFNADEWSAFLAGAKAGEFDLQD